MKALVALCGVLLTACSGYSRPSLTPLISTPEEMKFPTQDAADLWVAAVGDMYQPQVVVSETCVEGAYWCVSPEDVVDRCGGAKGAYRGCTDDGVIHIQRGMDPFQTLSTMTHEFGHTFDLLHTDDGTLMDPNRTMEVRMHPEVDAETVAAFRAEFAN